MEEDIAPPDVGPGVSRLPASPTALTRSMSGIMATSTLVPVALLIVVPAIFLRLYQLSTIPGEFYGDIAIIYEYVDAVLKGRWSFQFVLSTGPLYGYTIAPIIAVLGQQGYLPYKLASVAVSLGGILLTYLFARRLAGARIALLTGFILATSSWYLVFSRLGNAQIIIPVVVAGCFYLLARGTGPNGFASAIAGAVVSSLGFYTMPQTFILPLVYGAVAAFYLPLRRVVILCAVLLVSSLPFMVIVLQQPDLFFSHSGYIGGKIGSTSLPAMVAKVVDNGIKSLLMLHVTGDAVFRSNPPGSPQLDVISGLLFLLGLVYWFCTPRRKWLPMLVIPFLALQIPSVLVLSEVSPTPSASRTIGILPFVAVFVGSGLWFAYESIGRIRAVKGVAPLKTVVPAAIIVCVALLNYNRYFVGYAEGLPNYNTPIGKIIAAEIDRLPPQASVYVVGCCWGDWGQPELAGIQYVVKPYRGITFLQEDTYTCADIPHHDNAYVVLPPDMGPQLKSAVACLGRGETMIHTSPSVGVLFYSFSAAALSLSSSSPGPPSSPSPVASPTGAAAPLTLNALGLGSCRAGAAAGSVRVPAPAHIPLDALPALCGRVNLAAASHATWHTLTFRRGLQFTGKNSGAVFALEGRYRVLAGTIYLDNGTGTKGGIFDLYSVTAPGNTETYRLLYQTDIGLTAGNRATFSIPVSGVRYLAVVERCCPLQTTILDVMATLTRA